MCLLPSAACHLFASSGFARLPCRQADRAATPPLLYSMSAPLLILYLNVI